MYIKLIFVGFIFCYSLEAISLKNVIENTIKENPEIKSFHKNTQANKYYIDEERASFLPSLTLDAYYEKKDIEEKTKNSNRDSTQKGHNIILKASQLLYDGGKREARYEEQKNLYLSTKLANDFLIDNIIQTSLETYLDLVKYEEKLILDKHNLKVHENYLEIAINSEEVSGEKLDRLQVDSKLASSYVSYYEDVEAQKNLKLTLKEVSNLEIKNEFICRPIVDESLILQKEEDFIKEALFNNKEILEQITKIRKQNNVLSQNRLFLPSINAYITQEFDKDLDKVNTRKDELSFKIQLTYNLFNGFKDKSKYLQEKTFLNEAQILLDSLTNKVKKESAFRHFTYFNIKNKIKYLKSYILYNKEILAIYHQQFEGGTRTFLDLVNQEAEVFKAKNDLIEQEFLHFKNYYEILKDLGLLTRTVLAHQNTLCEKIVLSFDEYKSDSNDENDLIELLNDDLNPSETSLLNENKTDEKINSIAQDSLERLKDFTKDGTVNMMLDDMLTDIYNLKTDNDEKRVASFKIKVNNKVILPSLLKNDENNKINKKIQRKQTFDLKKLSSGKESLPLKIKTEFLKESSKYYTIVISNIKKNTSIKQFKRRYYLEDNYYNYKVKGKKRILYGVYFSQQEAEVALLALHPHLQRMQVTVDLIKNQKLLYKNKGKL
ncbi:MAG: hypothetical protein COA66_05490 [Arcobacter sp.]|nr:MAG: hypothetical protein COA66_05490 [Arcobacter sp.]